MKNQDKEIVYVIGHKNPDTDSVSSAIAYAEFLCRTNINAKAVICGNINKETKYFMDKYNLQVPDLLETAKGKKFVLVDHCSYLQAMDNMKNNEVIGIIDHHEKGDIVTDDIPYIKIENVGATVTLIYQIYKENNIEISKDIARVMLMGIISDTKNLKKHNVTDYDRQAFKELLNISEIKDDIDELFKDMTNALSDYEGMSDLEIFESDYKEYSFKGYKYGISIINTKDEKTKIDLAERMYKVMIDNHKKFNVDFLFAKISNSTEKNMYMVAYDDKSKEILNKAFNNYDGYKFFVFNESLSRKQILVPAINDVIDKNYR